MQALSTHLQLNILQLVNNEAHEPTVVTDMHLKKNMTDTHPTLSKPNISMSHKMHC